jgi:hypothetical protein
MMTGFLQFLPRISGLERCKSDPSRPVAFDDKDHKPIAEVADTVKQNYREIIVVHPSVVPIL